MKTNHLSDLILSIIRKPSVFISKKEYIFVMSHMRSYSTLLCHILGSHAEIDGYSELHDYYTSRHRLLKLRYNVYKNNGSNLSGRYVLDKVLHNYAVSEDILNQKNVHILFMLRNPERAIKSIAKMSKKQSNHEHLGILEYYKTRLLEMERIVKLTKNPTLYIKSESIIENTDLLLSQLTDWLKLESALKPQYNLFKHSGSPLYGDPSKNILAGNVKREINEHKEIELDHEIKRKAAEAYEHCLMLLEKYSSLAPVDSIFCSGSDERTPESEPPAMRGFS